jgi:hypothetical protein
MARLPPFRPFSADVVMAFATPNLRVNSRLETDLRFRSVLTVRFARKIVLASEVEQVGVTSVAAFPRSR